ncbi:retrovirus-related pol polyprotein from transposon TNT 1-94 [Tanacetum coccineum]
MNNACVSGVRFDPLPKPYDNLYCYDRKAYLLEDKQILCVRVFAIWKAFGVQFEPHVLASKAIKAAKNHDPLALIANSNSSSSQTHANSSYLPQPYYVTHPDQSQATHSEVSPTKNPSSRTSSNTRNQAVIQDGRVDIQTKNAGYGGNGNRNAGRQNRNQAFNARTANDESNQIVQRVPRTESTPGKANVQCYNYNEKGYYARDCPKARVRDAKYFREQMLLAMKYEAKSVTPRQWRKHKNET